MQTSALVVYFPVFAGAKGSGAARTQMLVTGTARRGPVGDSLGNTEAGSRVSTQCQTAYPTRVD